VPVTRWWERPGLEVGDGRLLVAGRDAEALAREHGTPLFVYDLVRIEEQARALESAFATIGAPFRLRIAIKAQRDPAVMAFVRGLGSVGVDACSPGEVRHALAHGFAADEVSYTGTNLSDRDVDVLLETGVHVNLDLLSQLRRWGRRAPGTTVGIRVNPRAGATRSAEAGVEAHESLYAGERPTKFGLFPEQLDEAVEVAETFDLGIDVVHMHTGDGFLTEDLPRFGVAVERLAAAAERIHDAGHPLAEVNVGGGLGVPQVDGDEPLDVEVLAELLVEHLGPLGLTIAAEPGDFLCKEMGVLLAEVVTVEERDGIWFVGLNAGFNIAPERFIYGSSFPITACAAADPVRRYVVAGNINEGPDLWGEVELPELAEGDVLALLNVGSYNQSMHMDHCLRPAAGVVAFAERS